VASTKCPITSRAPRRCVRAMLVCAGTIPGPPPREGLARYGRHIVGSLVASPIRRKELAQGLTYDLGCAVAIQDLGSATPTLYDAFECKTEQPIFG
jgi:hypothetical protein